MLLITSKSTHVVYCLGFILYNNHANFSCQTCTLWFYMYEGKSCLNDGQMSIAHRPTNTRQLQ